MSQSLIPIFLGHHTVQFPVFVACPEALEHSTYFCVECILASDFLLVITMLFSLREPWSEATAFGKNVLSKDADDLDC